MPLIHDAAIVLRRLDYSESSLVLVLMSRDHGKLRVIAKGARRSTRKRFSPGMDLLEAGDLVCSVRHVGQESLAHVTSWKQTTGFSGLRERLGRLNAAQYAADITSQLTEDWDPHPGLFESLYRTLEDLSDTHYVVPTIVSFQRTLLEQVGVSPRLDVCVGCGCTPDTAHHLYFSSHDGGIICRDCEPARIEKRQVRVSSVSLRQARPIADSDVPGMFDLYDYHISHLIGRPAAGRDALTRIAQEHCASPR